MRKTHYIFDLDDTLVNSQEYNRQVFVQTFKDHSPISETDEAYLRELHRLSRGKSMTSQFSEGIATLNLSAQSQALVAHNEKLQKEGFHSVVFFPYALELIQFLADSGNKVSLCSNRDKHSLTSLVAKNKLEHYFEMVVSCTELGVEKPEPFALEHILRESGSQKEEVIYFGDSETDQQFAEAAGVDYLILDHGINKNLVFKSLIELIGV